MGAAKGRAFAIPSMANAHVKKEIFNHEWTRMDTNFLSTEYTEETECLADVGRSSEDVVVNISI